MNIRITQLLLATTIGAAMAVSAQTKSPNPLPDPSPANAAAASPGGASSTTQDRMPAIRDQEAMRLCANAAAADREACIAREKARLASDKPMKSTSPMDGMSGSKASGQTSGMSGNGSTGGNTTQGAGTK